MPATTSRTSLVPDTLKDMAEDTELQAHLAELAAKGQAALTREEARARQRSLDNLGLPNFYQMASQKGLKPLERSPATTLQLNIGLYCNQACNHCHVESSPKRTEMMDRRTADRCLELLRGPGASTITCLDITGGAPELNTQFRHLVEGARAAGVREIIDRCNLTVLLEPGQEDLAAFLARHRVRVVASLPCYSDANVDAQRGAGVFERSIQGLQILNKHGYGQPGTALQLDLVYNPGGAFLAPSQAKLEPAYKSELANYGVTFSSLIALNNMPVKRFADWLVRRGKMDEYMQLLVNSFNPASGDGLMCRSTVSVDWSGRLYDCDFNQQLELSMAGSGTGTAGALTVFDIKGLDELAGKKIACDNHCYGCTAGSGSSCGGQL